MRRPLYPALMYVLCLITVSTALVAAPLGKQAAMWAFSSLILLAVLLSFGVALWSITKKRALFAQRGHLTFPQWYERYYQGSGGLPAEKVEAVLNCCAEALNLSNSAQLRPTDRLDVELSQYELSKGESRERLWKFLGGLVSETRGAAFQASPEWTTLDDVIRGTVEQMPRDEPPRQTTG
jgi:hypothetical protein